MDKLSLFSLQSLIESNAARLQAQEATKALPEIQAVRLLQEREGYQPCYARDTALVPGENGLCMVTGCCWRNFCCAYRSQAIPIDKYLGGVSTHSELAGFTSFLMSSLAARNQDESNTLAVTVKAHANLLPLSRKLAIGAARSMICESPEGSNALRPLQLSLSAQPTSSPYGGSHYTHYFELKRSVWWTTDPERIFNWRASAQSFIDSSIMAYAPHISTESEIVSVWKTNLPEFTQLASPVFNQLATPHLASPTGDIYVSDPNFVPLFNLEIPFLESTNLEDLHKLIEDYPDELGTLRNFLYRSIDGIHDKSLSSLTFGSDLHSIERDLDEHIRRLRSDLKKVKIKHMVEMVGGVSAAFVLSVYCIVQKDHHTWTIIGPGGFAYALSSKISEYLVSKLSLRDNPAYFLWMLGPSERI